MSAAIIQGGRLFLSCVSTGSGQGLQDGSQQNPKDDSQGSLPRLWKRPMMNRTSD